MHAFRKPYLLCSAFALLTLLQSAAQKPTAAAAAKPATAGDFAGEPAVILNRQSVVTMHADGTGLRQTTIAIRVQTDAAVRQFGVVAISFASASEHAEFSYVRVRHGDGAVTETPVKEALEQPEQVTREAPFYSDLKSLQLPVKDLRLGDTLEWQARVVRTVPEAPGQFWGQDTFVNDGIALDESFELHVPASSRVTIWTNPAVAPPADSTAGDERLVRWSSKHLVPSTGAEADAAKKKPLTPEQDLATRKGALPSLAFTTFPNWEAVGAWYHQLEADRVKPDSAVAAKVAQLTAGKTTQAEKAKAVYAYVATQIRYIGVALGVGRYQPHTAGEVLANQYGDCKDKHTLLAAMLTQIGLQPDAVLVGAGVRFNAAVPSPGSFNHLITHVDVDGTPVWLDTTAEVAPWGTLLPLIRDQQVLVVPDASTAKLAQTPATPPFQPYARLDAKEELGSDLNSDARMTVTFHDDDELGLRALLRQVSPAQYQTFLERFIAALGFGGTVSEPEISRPDDLEHPLTISYRYKRIKDADWGENRVTEPFWPIMLPTVNEKEPPVGSIELGTPRTETSTVEIKLPAKWTAELPEAIHAKAAFASSDTTFHLDKGVLVGERKLTVLQPRVPAADWKVYKKWADDAQFSSYPFIQLVSLAPTGALPAATKASSTDTPSGSAEQLVTQAEDAIRAGNTTDATQLLDKAKALNAQQRYLWSEYASVSMLLGKMNQAKEEATKELQLHPDEVRINSLLAGVQENQRDYEGALVTLRHWKDSAPDDQAPVLMMVPLLEHLKRDAEATEVASAALSHFAKEDGADTTQVRLMLASLQAKAGKKEEAAQTVLPLAKTAANPVQQNSVAFILADAKINLPEDESMEHDVLAKLDTQSAAWTLDESPVTLIGTTNLLVAAWDTMGWILFQEGHPTEARDYVEAAWRNAPRPDLEEHLRAIDSALHQASAVETGSEQSRRTFPLGPARGRHGTSELRLLLGEGKVLRAEAASPAPDDNSPGKTALPLAEATELAKAADVHALFPHGSAAHLVRRGFVNCAGTTCELILQPMTLR